MTTKAISVKQLNFYAKSLIENDRNLKSITVKGEISNFVLHQRSGHAYFTLKEDSASIKAVIFSSNMSTLTFMPKDGMQVYVQGRVSIYERDGQFQLYATNIILQGIGDSYLAFLELKEKLEKEGLFSSETKKPLPKYPEKIGIITSPTGAAIQDFFNVTKKRFPSANLFLYPATVQGENTVPDVLKGIEYFENNHVDVIVITRGGGSYEDLSQFNSEALARRVFMAKPPIVSAIGHEIDFTILDFVADFRAPTPSAAAETVLPDKENLLSTLYEKQKYLENIIKNKIASDKMVLSIAFSKIDPTQKIKNEAIYLDTLYTKIMSAEKTSIREKILHLKNQTEKINALNPLSVLSRGFSLTLKEGKKINSVKDISRGEKLTVIVKDGEIDCVAEEIRRNDI